jgi:hypothetical protein
MAVKMDQMNFTVETLEKGSIIIAVGATYG